MSGARNASSSIAAPIRAATSNAVAEAADVTVASSPATVRSRAKAPLSRERLLKARPQPKGRLRPQPTIVPTDIARTATGPRVIVLRVSGPREIVRKVIVRRAGTTATTTIAATKAAVSVREARVPRAATTGPVSVLAVQMSAQAIAQVVNASSRRVKPRVASAKSSPIPIRPSQNCWPSSSNLKAKARQAKARETRRAAIEPRAAPA